VSSSATQQRGVQNPQTAGQTFVPVPPPLWPQDIAECADLCERWGGRGISLVWSIEPVRNGTEVAFEPRLEAMRVQQVSGHVAAPPQAETRLSDEQRSFISSVASTLGRAWAKAMRAADPENKP
jgi:hypothetical protein